MIRRSIVWLGILILAAPASGQTLRIATATPYGLDPHATFQGPDMAVSRMLYDTFVGRDGESRWTPALALSWSAPDDRTWLFQLRPGVLFADGTPFTADDVVFSIQRARTIESSAPFTANLRSITGVFADGPLIVRITTDRPNAVLPGQMTNIFVMSARAATLPLADIQSGRAGVGTGPFRAVGFTRGERLDLVRNERYWGSPPPWATVTERVIPNDAARVTALLANDVDLIDSVAPAYVERLEHTQGVRVFRHPSDRVMFLQPNVRVDRSAFMVDTAGAPLPTNPLRDKRVRQALSLAIDRRALAQRAFEGDAVPATQLVPPGFGGFDPALPILPTDLPRARALLAEAGYPQGFGLTIACTNNRYVSDERVCQVLGQMLERVGIRMKVETLPGAVLFPRARPEVNEWPLLLMGQSNSTSRDPTHVLSIAMHSPDADGDGTSNRGGFRDAGLDAAIDAALRRLDPAREEALHAAMMRGIEMGALIPLYVQTVVVAARNGITYQPRMDEQTVAQAATPP